MSRIIDELKRTDHKRYLGGLDFFKYIGPGLLVTVGFIDPGNWRSEEHTSELQSQHLIS